MKPRVLAPLLRKLADDYPIVTVTGPRQSGKTTLCRGVFPDKPYVSLEPLDRRQYAIDDPRGFLDEYRRGAVIDEVQNAPDLASYLQEAVDDDPTPGRFILTGSRHFGLSQSISQSLAGRAAILHLQPLSLDERRFFTTSDDELFPVLFSGGYPRIHEHRLDPARWLTDYVATYVERDVRQLSNIGDLGVFTQFLQLCAARTGQEVNLSALGADAGISHNTVKAWLGVLEASFLVFQCPSWQRNLRKQLVKAPKLHFIDSGLACHLLGIRNPEQLRHHPLRGPLFESWVAAEIYKHRAHRGLPPNLRHFRESRGLEVDILVEDGLALTAVEVKSGATVDRSFLKPLERFRDLLAPYPELSLCARLVHGGEGYQRRTAAEVIGWREMAAVEW